MGWWKTAKPGDFVVCIQSSHGCEATECLVSPPWPIVAGKVYEVAECFDTDSTWPLQGIPVVRLLGHNNGLYVGNLEGAWMVEAFRPVKPSRVAFVKSLLAPKDEHA